MIPENVPNLEELFFKLSRIIDFNEQRKKNLIKRLKKRKPWETVIVSDNLSWSEFSRLNLFVLLSGKVILVIIFQFLTPNFPKISPENMRSCSPPYQGGP